MKSKECCLGHTRHTHWWLYLGSWDAGLIIRVREGHTTIEVAIPLLKLNLYIL